MDTNRLFIISMWWRILYGVFRIVLGLALLDVIGAPLLDMVTVVMNHELAQDPSDVLYQLVSTFLNVHPLQVTYFLALYFIFWGLVDAVLSYNLIRHKLWAFPVSLFLISFFVVYELIRYMHTNSSILLGVILLDVLILWFIGKEYQKVKSV